MAATAFMSRTDDFYAKVWHHIPAVEWQVFAADIDAI